MSPTTPTASAARVDVRRLDRGSHREAYVTGLAAPDAPAEAAAGALFEALAAVYAGGLRPFVEKVYGALGARDEVLARRADALRAAGLDPDLPCTYLEGRPAAGGDVAGVQAWAVDPGAGAVTTVPGASGTPGRLWTGPGHRLLYLPSARGEDARGAPLPDPAGQAEGMFLAAEAALARQGFDFQDVRRTWIYCARLLDCYADLNRVRTRFFHERGVGAAGRFPASTGIQGTSRGEAFCMDLLAIQAPPGAVEPLLESERQGPAARYGSAFSRAMRVGLGAGEAVLVSGTASIDPQGRTRFVGDADAQVLETLLSIAALLARRGGGLADIQQATLFCKAPEHLRTFEQVTRLLGVPAFPVLPIVADVCRPELLVEVEAIAVIGAGRVA